MSTPHIRREVQLMLDELNEHIADAQRKLADGAYKERVDAAGELVVLIRQKGMIEGRLKEVERNYRSSEDMFAVLREEMFNLSLRFRQFLSRG